MEQRKPYQSTKKETKKRHTKAQETENKDGEGKSTILALTTNLNGYRKITRA